MILYTHNIWYACFEPKVTCMPVVYQNNMLTRIEPLKKKKKDNKTQSVMCNKLETQNYILGQLI